MKRESTTPFFEKCWFAEQDATTVKRPSHFPNYTVESLQVVNQGLELVCQLIYFQVDLTRTWEIFGEITGDAAPDELITQLFSQFCLENE